MAGTVNTNQAIDIAAIAIGAHGNSPDGLPEPCTGAKGVGKLIKKGVLAGSGAALFTNGNQNLMEFGGK